METLILFLTIIAVILVSFYTVLWTLTWVAFLGTPGARLNAKARAFVLPLLAWTWLLTWWLA